MRSSIVVSSYTPGASGAVLLVGVSFLFLVLVFCDPRMPASSRRTCMENGKHFAAPHLLSITTSLKMALSS